ncbi:hypothetical protein PL8927_830140 [Planktothrix serta PCC 8927]|uniref:Uncharacterized protein n=1 Tax=Planktothrix serta PCC 8927 TaxID=671068 RepID=A0A7Z9E3L7_9CYAN|nr:hypothetical protein [Planktothrix serta]VXD24786.1 hypothetical protein PL8927_830140 [Planktothrix serta PCC 8927]
MKEITNFSFKIDNQNLENYGLPPEDPLGELSDFELGLRRFCYECNQRVIWEIGEIQFTVFFDPDICMLFEDRFPEQIGQLEQGQNIRIDFVESCHITVILTHEGEQLHCQLREFNDQHNQYNYKLDKQQVLRELRTILFEVMILAWKQGYVTKEDMYEFIKPAFSSPHESLTRENLEFVLQDFKLIRPAVKYGLEQSGK